MDLVTIAGLDFPQNSLRAEKCEQILSKTCERPGELDLHWAERASAHSFGKSSSCVGDGMLVHMRLDHSLVADCCDNHASLGHAGLHSF
jgi:hypothetical protein